MHIVKDENGNMIPHGSEHCHEHTHDHDHDHHHHDHPHMDSCESTTDGKEKSLTLMKYMLHHNEHHAEELAQMADNLSGAAAEAVREAVAEFQKGNEKLSLALHIMESEI
ncbi:MAG: cobalt transporter [Candidatus Limivivens sp.]|nr:cobalt transporter [Candidatus Limivivens sp.]